MIRCNTSISLITVTVDGWLAGCTGEAGDTRAGCTGEGGDTRGVCTGGTAAATTIIDEASRRTSDMPRAHRPRGERRRGTLLHLSQRLTALANCAPMRSAVSARRTERHCA
jgi:hypothetical protein